MVVGFVQIELSVSLWYGNQNSWLTNPRSGCQHKAWGVSRRIETAKCVRARSAGVNRLTVTVALHRHS